MTLLVKNEKADQNFVGRGIDYSGTAVGALRVSSLLRGVARLWNEVAATPSVALKRVDDVAGTTMTGLGIVRLPSVTREAMTDIARLHDSDLDGRKVLVATRSTLDAISSWLTTGFLLTANLALKNISSVCDLGQDTADAQIAWTDHNKALASEQQSSGEIREAFAHARKYNMLRMAKAILSIAAACFAIWTMLVGSALLPVLGTIVLALATTIIAIRRDLYKEEGAHKLIDLSRHYRI